MNSYSFAGGDHIANATYHFWDINENSVRVFGGKKSEYIHNCPLNDFHFILEKSHIQYLKNGSINKYDLLIELENERLDNNRIFIGKSHKYKIKMVFDILLMENVIEKVGTKTIQNKKSGKRPYLYKLIEPEITIIKWLEKLNIK